MRFATAAIRAFQAPDPETGAVIPPIYQTSTFAQISPGEHKGFDYTRSANPNRFALEGVLAELEGGTHALCYTTGIGALSSLCFALFKPGDHLVVSDNVYGGTHRFLTHVLSTYNVDVEFVDMTEPSNVEAAIKPNTRLVYMESPTNPLLKILDIERLVAIARGAKTDKPIITCLDNTFASPWLQKPLKLGVDIVLQSTTKYIAGHSDVLGGALILKDESHYETLEFHQKTIGATPDPFACWLTLRGVKTLAVRMKLHCDNALAIARHLERHPAVETVIYPGLESHPQHALAKRQMKGGYGGVVSIRLKGDEATTCRFAQDLKLFTLAESLGGVESLINHPCRMTHKSVPEDERNSIGITGNLLRLSIGIEDVDDLIDDLEQALARL